MSNKWESVQATLDSWVEAAFESGDLPGDGSEHDVERWVHETADGCEFVIWWSEVMDIWNSSPEVQDFEWSAAECFTAHQTILERMTIVVLLAIEDHLRVSIQEYEMELERA